MPQMTEDFENGFMVITHPTGVVDKYDEEHLHKLFEVAEAERDAANKECITIDELIAELKESRNPL